MELLTQTYTLTGAGTEIDNFNVADVFERYIVKGTAVGIGNYAISIVGTPTTNTRFLLEWRGSLDITTTPVTFSILGQSITANQLLYDFDAECTYNGTTWDVNIQRSDTSVTTETANVANNAITNAKLAQMATNTVKANVTGSTADPQDVSISTFFGNTAWKTTGNSGTVAGTNFIGTTDNTDLVFKTLSLESGRINLSLSNTSFGFTSLTSVTTGSTNSAFGTSALTSLSSGIGNTAIGSSCAVNLTTGAENTIVGQSAGGLISTGSFNTLIGDNANTDSAIALNRIALGYGATATADYQFIIPTNITTVEFGSAELSIGTVIEDRSTVAINATNTATAAQIRTGYITSTSAAPTTITLPTGTLLGNELGATQGMIHKFYVDNTAGSSTVTIAVAVDGVLSALAAANAASFGLLTVPIGVTGIAEFTIMFNSPTTYCFSRTA